MAVDTRCMAHKSWVDKLRIWFMPTGWRPADVKEQYPVTIITDVYDFKKYQPTASLQLKGYSYISTAG